MLIATLVASVTLVVMTSILLTRSVPLTLTAPVVVLDEPTNALDPHHEAVVTQSLRNLKRQRTIVLVSHRLSTVVDCDQIFVMDGGRIVERGTHDELVARGATSTRTSTTWAWSRTTGGRSPPTSACASC